MKNEIYAHYDMFQETFATHIQHVLGAYQLLEDLEHEMTRIVEKPNTPASSEMITRLRALTTGTVPASYEKFLLAHNGGNSPHSKVRLADGTKTSGLDFLGIDLSGTRSILNVKETADQLEDFLLPVAFDAGSNLFCVSTRPEDNGSVWFWDHDIVESIMCFTSWEEFERAVADASSYPL